MTTPPARADTPLDLDAIRNGLEAYEAAVKEALRYGKTLPFLASYVTTDRIRALVAEVERLHAKLGRICRQIDYPEECEEFTHD